MLKISLPIEPVGKGRPRSTKTGRVYTPQKTRDNQKQIQNHLQQIIALNKPYFLNLPRDEFDQVTIEFYLPRPKRLYRRKDPVGRIPHRTKPDLDNLLKQILDSCEGYLWNNDKTIHNIHPSKWYCEAYGKPRIEISIS